MTLPIPGVAFDLASFSFHVPSCRSAAKDTAPTKEQIATVNPIVLIFMALIETGFRSVVNAFLASNQRGSVGQLSVSRFRPAQRPPRIQVASPLARERGG